MGGCRTVRTRAFASRQGRGQTVSVQRPCISVLFLATFLAIVGAAPLGGAAGTWPARSSIPGESRAGLSDRYGADLVRITAFDVVVRTRASARQCRRRSVRCWQGETRRPVLRTG